MPIFGSRTRFSNFISSITVSKRSLNTTRANVADKWSGPSASCFGRSRVQLSCLRCFVVPSGEANSCSAAQESPRISLSPNVHYKIPKNAQEVRII